MKEERKNQQYYRFCNVILRKNLKYYHINYILNKNMNKRIRGTLNISTTKSYATNDKSVLSLEYETLQIF